MHCAGTGRRTGNCWPFRCSKNRRACSYGIPWPREHVPDSTKKDIPIFAVTTQEKQTFYRSKPLLKPGVYHLSTGNNIYPIAVNMTSDEADVRTLPEPAVRKALGDIALTMHADQAPMDSAMQLNTGRDLGWSIMLLVLGLAAFECFVAMRFGHHRRLARA